MSDGVDWSQAVKLPEGGYCRLEDYCNRQDRGDGLVFTASCVLMAEELLGVECGWRVANAVIEYAVDGWDALMDASYAEYVAAASE